LSPKLLGGGKIKNILGEMAQLFFGGNEFYGVGRKPGIPRQISISGKTL
jgi:hypothetical protein